MKKLANQKELSIRNKLLVTGTNFAAGVGVLTFIGYHLDRKFGHEALYTVSGALLGVTWGIYETIKTALLSSKASNDQNPTRSGENN